MSSGKSHSLYILIRKVIKRLYSLSRHVTWSATYKILSNTLLSNPPPYREEIIENNNLGVDFNVTFQLLIIYFHSSCTGEKEE